MEVGLAGIEGELTIVTERAGLASGDNEKLRRGVYWATPKLYGEAEALNNMGSIAAPLLAGFCLAATVQTLTITTRDARWPNIAVLLFMLASLLFIATLQVMLWARRYHVVPSELTAWWPDADQPRRSEELQRIQQLHAAGFRLWANRARIAYRAAQLCLSAGFTILAVPPESPTQLSIFRWLAVGIGAAGFTSEVIWIVGSSRWNPPSAATDTPPLTG